MVLRINSYLKKLLKMLREALNGYGHTQTKVMISYKEVSTPNKKMF